MSVWKIVQRQFYDILSNKCFLLLFVLLAYSTLISILHFCEVWLNGNLSFKNKLTLGKDDFGDSIGTKSLQDQLCQYFPIDVVYTWVNGSDPNFINQLRSEEKRVRKELSLTCSLTDCLPSHLTAFRLSTSKLQDILNKLNYVSVKPVKVEDKDWTVLRWDSVKTAEEESEKLFDVNRYSVPAFHVHWTTGKLCLFLCCIGEWGYLDANFTWYCDDELDPSLASPIPSLMLSRLQNLSAPSLYLPSNTIAIKGVNKSLESVTQNLESLLEHNFGQMIASIWRYPQVIFAELHSQFDLQQILKGKKWNIIFIKHVMKLNVTRAGLVLEIPSQIQPDDYSPSRYEDKEVISVTYSTNAH
ncbi:hypothetical protein J6590_066275 [Homalodisca vitripennis]|nr:hypothetical protein J6590_066275 [Homalodisca vitripennis]